MTVILFYDRRDMVGKRYFNVILLLLLFIAMVLMVFTNGITMYSAPSPGELIPNSYSYLDPMVYFGGGIYFAPAAVFLTAVSLVSGAISVLRSGYSGKTAFFTGAAAFLCSAAVPVLLPATLLTILIGLLLAAAAVVAYWIAYRLK